MKATLTISARRTLLSGLVVMLAALGLSSCGVTDPQEAAWEDVSSFAWPTAPNTLMKYRNERVEAGAVNVESLREVRPEVSSELYRDQPMYELMDPEESSRLRLRFLPLKDTLVTRNAPFGAEFALVAPLEVGHSWTASYRTIGGEQVPDLQATILDRASHLKLDGNTYQNVLVVRYESLRNETDPVWICFYAQGNGTILSVQKVYQPNQTASVLIDPQTIARQVLVDIAHD